MATREAPEGHGALDLAAGIARPRASRGAPWSSPSSLPAKRVPEKSGDAHEGIHQESARVFTGNPQRFSREIHTGFHWKFTPQDNEDVRSETLVFVMIHQKSWKEFTRNPK